MPTILGTRKLRFYIGATEYTDAVSDVRIVSGEKDSDFISFADAAAGGARDYTLKLTLKQDTAAASLWYYAWGSSGTDVGIVIWPNGGTTPSATTPKFTGTVTVVEPDGDLVGGEANASNSGVFTSEFEWKFTAKPALVIV